MAEKREKARHGTEGIPNSEKGRRNHSLRGEKGNRMSVGKKGGELKAPKKRIKAQLSRGVTVT